MVRTSARLVALFGIPFLLVSAFIRVAAPPNPDYVWHPTFTAKVDFLRETDQHFDVVFVGNSRTYLGVDPTIVDATMAADGCQAISYNFGSVAQSKFEFDYALEVLGETPGGVPEYVVSLDQSLFEIGLLRDFSVRNRVFMTPGNLSDALSYIGNLPADEGLKSKAKVIDLAGGFAVAQLPIGAVHQQLFDQYSLEDEVLLVDEWRGYKPWPEIRAERGSDEIEGLRATLDAAVESGEWEYRWSPKEPSQDHLDRWVSTIAAHVEQAPEGSTPIHVLIPSDMDHLTAAAIADAWDDSGHSEILLNLVDEDLVGDYTDPAYWSDTLHVGDIGTEAISTALGHQICSIMQANGDGEA